MSEFGDISDLDSGGISDLDSGGQISPVLQGPTLVAGGFEQEQHQAVLGEATKYGIYDQQLETPLEKAKKNLEIKLADDKAKNKILTMIDRFKNPNQIITLNADLFIYASKYLILHKKLTDVGFNKFLTKSDVGEFIEEHIKEPDYNEIDVQLDLIRYIRFVQSENLI